MLIIDFPIYQILLANFVLLLGSCLQGVAGYGIGTLSAPLVFLINPEFLPGPMIANAVLLNLLMFIRNRRHITLSPVRHAIWGSIVGILLAGATLQVLSPAGFDLAFGILILLAVLLSVIGLKPSLTRNNSVIAGGLSGYMGTITAVGGPPMGLIYQNESGPRVRGNLAAFFLFSSIVSLAILVPTGFLGWYQVKLVVVTFPGVFVGFWLSRFLVNRLPFEWMRPLVLTIAAFAGVVAIGKWVIGFL